MGLVSNLQEELERELNTEAHDDERFKQRSELQRLVV